MNIAVRLLGGKATTARSQAALRTGQKTIRPLTCFAADTKYPRKETPIKKPTTQTTTSTTPLQSQQKPDAIASELEHLSRSDEALANSTSDRPSSSPIPTLRFPITSQEVMGMHTLYLEGDRRSIEACLKGNEGVKGSEGKKVVKDGKEDDLPPWSRITPFG